MSFKFIQIVVRTNHSILFLRNNIPLYGYTGVCMDILEFAHLRTFKLCYVNAYVLQKFICWDPKLQCNGIWKWHLCLRWGHGGDQPQLPKTRCFQYFSITSKVVMNISCTGFATIFLKLVLLEASLMFLCFLPNSK